MKLYGGGIRPTAHKSASKGVKGGKWKPTYQVFRKLPDGSQQAVAVYFTLEEAQAKAKALEKNSQGHGRDDAPRGYFALDLLVQTVVSPQEADPATTPAKLPP